MLNFGTPGQLFKKTNFSAQIEHSEGVGGGSPIFLLLLNPNILWYGGEKERREIPKIVAYLSCSSGRTHFAWTILLT
jgi:hypothetical protein